MIGEEKASWSIKAYINRAYEVFENNKPFQNDINLIKINYDKSIGVFYELCQYLFIFNLITCLLFIYLNVVHFLDNRYFLDAGGFYSGLCGYGFPCFFFYSRYAPTHNFEFGLTNLLFILIGAIYFTLIWIKFDRDA